MTWYAHGSKPDALLAKQVKHQATLSKIPFMNTAQGRRVYNPKDVANCFSKFYTKLYNLNAPHGTFSQSYTDRSIPRLNPTPFSIHETPRGTQFTHLTLTSPKRYTHFPFTKHLNQMATVMNTLNSLPMSSPHTYATHSTE